MTMEHLVKMNVPPHGEQSKTKYEPLHELDITELKTMQPVSVTPWPDFLVGVLILLFCFASMVVLQIIWFTMWQGKGTVSWLPISLLVLPPAAWICFPHFAPSRMVGVACMLEWLFQGNEVMGHEDKVAESRLDQIEQHDDSGSGDQQVTMRYRIGYAAMFVVFWLLIVGNSIWPFGYLYLAEYSLTRCQGVCKQLENAGNGKEKTSRWLVLPDNVTWDIDQLRDGCSRATDNWRNNRPQMEILDIHWLLPSLHSQAIGYDFQIRLTSHEGKPVSFRPGCETGRYQRILMLLISGALIVLAAIPIFRRQNHVIVAALVVLEVVLIAGAALVWRNWGACDGEGHRMPDDVLAGFLSSCNKTAFYPAPLNGTTSNVHHFWQMFWRFEGRFRRHHQLSRYELWMGRWTAAFWLLLSLMAHSTSWYKRMQTSEARIALLRRNPRLVDHLLEEDRLSVLKCLPGWHGIRLLSNLLKVLDERGRAGSAAIPRKTLEWLKTEKPYTFRAEGVQTSFRLAFLYASGKALMPTFAHLIFTSPQPGESNVLVMLSCLVAAVLLFLVYLFTYFHLCEAVRHYDANVKVWLLFDICWKFPSRNGLMGDPLVETVKTKNGKDNPLRIELAKVLTNFGGGEGANWPSLQSCRCSGIPAESGEDEVANWQNVKASLGIWWAWREYLIIDQMDSRVRLELHLLLMLAATAVSCLLFTPGTSWVDYFRTGSPVSLAWKLSHEATEHITQALLAVWGLLFLFWPVLHSLKCAADTNHRLSQQLSNVEHLKSIFLQQTEGKHERELHDKVGRVALNVFRLALAEQETVQGSSLQVFNLIKIDSRMLKIVGVLLSFFTGSQVVDLGDKVLQTIK